jgi:uncharacterized protein (DUF427 family)
MKRVKDRGPAVPWGMKHPRRIEPGPGQESVWDYPRPPRLEPQKGRVVVKIGDVMLCDTTSALRVLETSHPPTVYVPPGDCDLSKLRETRHQTGCEWKGTASYYDLVEPAIEDVAWFYKKPVPSFAALKDYLAFYPSKVQCSIDGEPVAAQEGDFYGGWKTSRIVGPFKGGPGTWGW